MRNVNNTPFGIYQSIVFVNILVLEWEINKRMIFDPGIMFLGIEINKRMICDPGIMFLGIMFLLEEVYS